MGIYSRDLRRRLDYEEVIPPINNLAASYGDDNPVHQVLVQAMLTDVQAHGVVFTLANRTLAVRTTQSTIISDRTPKLSPVGLAMISKQC